MTASSFPDVSTRATAAPLDVLESWGYPLEPLVDGLPYDLAHLRSAHNRIDWDSFALFLERVRETVGWERLGQFARALSTSPSWDWSLRFARWLVSPRQFVLASLRFAGPIVWPSMPYQVRELADGRIELELRVPPGGRPSPEFFTISRHHIASQTRFLGLPDSRVEAEIEPERARYLVTPPHSKTFASGLARGVRTLLGSPAAMRELVKDQDELRRTTEELGRTRDELYEVLASLPVAVCLHKDQKVVYGNPELARVMGFGSPEEMIGEPILSHAHVEDHELVAKRLAAVAAGERLDPAELRFVRRDGTLVVLELTPVPPVHYGGQRVHVVVARDVTDQKRMQRQLVLADRMASIGTLAAGVAHEINNPLTWLSGSLDILERELDRMERDGSAGDRLGVLRDAVRAAVDGTRRVSTIVGDLRTLSRPPDEPLEPIDAADVLDSAVRIATKQLHERARLVREYEDTPEVLATHGRLGQVFLNLLLNAAQAIPPGAPDRHEIRLRVRPGADGRVVVEVSDTGPGIPPHLLSRIFDPFFSTKPGEGTGLGLSISLAIVTRLGGELVAEPGKGEGTTMRVLLPAAPRARPAVRPAAH